MASARAKLILHPIRLRLLSALARRQLTAGQLSELLPDVPLATLYAHLGRLTRGGVLRVVAERKVRGTLEKVYALFAENASLGPRDMADISPEDHLQYFALFVATVLSDFDRYLHSGRPLDFVADGVGYRQTPFYLSDEELMVAAAAVNRALLPFFANEPAPNRRRRLYTTIVFPDVDPAGTSPGVETSNGASAK